MSLSSTISVTQGATGATLTGGAAVSFVNDGQGSNGKKVLIDSSNGDINTRKKVITGVTVGALPARVGALAKLHRGSCDIHQPFVDSAGVKYNLADNFAMSYHPEQTLAQRQAKFWNTIAIIIDSELAGPLTNAVND